MASRSSGIDRPDPVSDPLPGKPWRAPLLWLLLPGICGYSAAEFIAMPAVWSLLLPALLLCALSAFLHKHTLWYFLLPLAVSLMAFSWAHELKLKQPEIWSQLPPREVVLNARTLEIFAGKKYPDRKYAILKITDAPAFSRELIGQKVFASIRQDSEDKVLKQGGSVRVLGVLEPVQPDTADFTAFLNSRSAHFTLHQGLLLEVLSPPHPLQAWLVSRHRDWSTWLSHSTEAYQAEAGLLAAMILGERVFLNAEQERTFLAAGAMHLFAVSGLHVMIVGLTLDLLLNLLRLSLTRRRLIVLVCVGLYVAVIGFSPSAVRAFSLLALYALASIIPRPAKAIPVVLASAVITLLISPAQLYSIGFQLSYSVVLAILALGLPVDDLIQNRWFKDRFTLKSELSVLQRFSQRVRSKFISSVCISFSATLGSAPLIILHFNLWTPGAILLNAILVPMATVVVASGVGIVLVQSVGAGFLAVIFAYPAWIIIRLMLYLSRVSIEVPGFYAEVVWHSSLWAYVSLTTFLLLLLIAPVKVPSLYRLLYFGCVSGGLLGLILMGTHPK